jgi:hypothetical protein
MAWVVAAAAVVIAAAAVVALTVGNPFDKTVVGIGSPAAAAEDEAGTDSAPELPSFGGATDDGDTGDAPSTPTEPDAANGDLGLSVPISSPACDSTWVVFLGASTDPATYVSDLSALLASQPGAQYLLTEGGCASMRQQLPDGSLIYSVYLGPFPDQASACATRNGIGGLAYVKRMDNVTPPEQLWEC